jgi:hypothetical protein
MDEKSDDPWTLIDDEPDSEGKVRTSRMVDRHLARETPL